MSVGGIGSGHQAQLNQILSKLFSRLDSADGSAGSSASSSSTDSAAPSASTGASSDAVGRLSDEILALLVQLQQAGSGGSACGSDCGGDAGSAGSTDATSQAGQTGQSAVQQLFSAIDTNGDGAISKSEFESYITQNGGTQQEADAIFSQLDPSGTGSINENQLADAAKAGRHHGHHHHHGGVAQAADNLFSAIDTDGDGSISKQELETFVTQQGGTTAEADQDYAALDPDNTGSVSKSQFEQAFQQLSFSGAPNAAQGAASDGTASPLANLLDKFTLTPLDTTGRLRPIFLSPNLQTSLFSSLDGNGDGSLTQSEVEQGVTKAGGTTAAADALFAQLDPTGSGSVSQAQFTQNLWPQPDRLFDWSRANVAGGSAQDAIAALLQTPTSTQTA